MIKKNYCVLSDSTFTLFLKDVIKIFGLPEIQQEFSIFAFNKKKDELHIHCTHGKIRMRLIPKDHLNSTEMSLHNRNIKQLFRMTAELGFTEATMGTITSYVFQRAADAEIKVSKSTFLGTLLEFHSNGEPNEKLNSLIEKFQLTTLNREDLQREIASINIPKEPIFDQLQCINSKIKDACQILGIDVFSPTSSLRNRFQKFSNDYSTIEMIYKELLGVDLNGLRSTIQNVSLFEPLSIIIPCFNSNETIPLVLKAIQNQNILKQAKQLIQVILVDDGSTIPVSSIGDVTEKNFDFELQIVRLEKNTGLSAARNLGVSLSKYEHLVFIDSDILLSKDYLLEHSVRSQIIPNAIFVSMKKNVNLEEISIPKNGLPNTKNVDDMRCVKNVSRSQPTLYSFKEDTTIELLNDTNYFKDFSFGRHVGIFDLPAMVVGHNISVRKKILKDIGGFSSEFTGWGMEDAYFGAKAIALGNYIIPILSANTYHINHLPRSGSEEGKIAELRSNVLKYEELLDRQYPEY